MNTIYINGRFLTQNITGVQRYSIELTKALDALLSTNEIDSSKFKFILISPKKGVIHKLKLQSISYEPKGFFSGHLWEQFELPFFTKNTPLLCFGNTAPLFSLAINPYVITTVHDLSYLYFPSAYSRKFRAFYSFLIPLVLKHSKLIITVSRSELTSIVKYHPFARTKIVAIQNGGLTEDILVDDAAYKLQNPLTPYILYVGALSKRKNIEGILHSFIELSSKHESQLIIVGATNANFEKFNFLIPEHISRRIKFLGQIEDIRTLIELYSKAQCLVFPSFYEASPLPVLEAMSCGCPVISSDIPSLRERCGDAALYCNPNNPEDICEKICDLIENEEKRKKLAEKGKSWAKKFTWEKCALETFNKISQILS